MRYRNITEFKYLLHVDYTTFIPNWKWGAIRLDPYIRIGANGLVLIRAGYPWDGPSGPTWDRKENIEGSLVHDAWYECIRAGLLPMSSRPAADALMAKMCVAAGMNPTWAKWFYERGLKIFGARAARRKPSKKYKVYIA